MSGMGCFMGYAVDPDKLILISGSVFLAVLTFALLRKFNFSTKIRISLIYGHLSFLFFPLAIYSINMSCGIFCMSCYNNLFHLAIYALPTTLIASTVAGFVVIPTLYTFTNKKMVIKNTWITKFVSIQSKKLNVKMPKLYAINKANPIAFSFRSFKSAIFLSVGLFEILNKKEIKAVLLHELAHLKQRSSALKLSNHFLRFFSPLSVLTRFHHDSNSEETEADNYVVTIQGTDRYLLSAKKKLNEYEKEKPDL
jgi:Zn-dependent protease with chaperone function